MMWSMLKVTDFTIEPVERKVIQSFVHKWHYSHSTNGVQQTQCFALFNGEKLIGAMMYALPSMKSTAAKYNPDNPLRCWELRRLCCIDDTPTNTESYFIGQTMRWLKKNTKYRVIVSFADTAQGHEGTIYKATNFKHKGMTAGAKALFVDGERLHQRMLTKKCPKGDEIRRRIKSGDDESIWTEQLPPKHIYVYYLNKKLNRIYN